MHLRCNACSATRQQKMTLNTYADLIHGDLELSRSACAPHSGADAAIPRAERRPAHMKTTMKWANPPTASVRAEGFEPSRSLEHRHLKPACLPFHHARSLPIVPLLVIDKSIGDPPYLGLITSAEGARKCDPQRSSKPRLT
jgi:hypothetical protein